MDSIATEIPAPRAEYDLTTPAVSRLLGCSRRAIPRLVSAGLLSEHRVPGTWPRYSRAEVEQLAGRCRRRGQG